MMSMVTHRSSSFGIECIKCCDEVIAPEGSECRNERQVHHFWRCPKCDCCFESLVSFPADGKSLKDVMTRGDVW
jgi:hypothetical protein